MPTLINKADNSIEYFGALSWANLLDWMVTLCLGGILVLTALLLGGVRPETQLLLQPLFVLLLALHGLSLAVSKRDERKLNPLPFLFIPFILWALASALLWTPTPWRGNYEWGYFFNAFIFGWVAVNNVRTRAHLWVLLILSILPLAQGVFIGYSQFFQDPTRLADAALSYPLELNSQYRGEATGLFADSGSFAALLIMLLPCFTIAALVPRLSMILRVLSFYLALILVVGITLTQTYWAVASVVVLMVVVPFFCFKGRKQRYLFSLLGVGIAFSVFISMYLFNPLFERGLARAITPEGEGIRLVLWDGAMSILAQNPIFGSGAGSFSYMVERNADLSLARLPITPHNDFLLILSGYGIVGACLLFLPFAYALYRALRHWLKEPFRLKGRNRHLMSAQKFFLSLSICAVVAIILCASFHFLIYVPALLLYAALLFSIMAKLSFRRSINFPKFRFFGALYFLLCLTTGASFWVHNSLSLESQGLELQARQRLESLVDQGIAVSGSSRLVDTVVRLYEDALIADSGNVDAWIGLSMAVCQLHYRDPSNFESTGARAVEAASRAYEISPEYWLASAQLGVALALSGQIEEADFALKRAVKLAPNSSNAHFYYAAFLGDEASKREEAIQHVSRALEIDPGNAVARRLKQKLLIL